MDSNVEYVRHVDEGSGLADSSVFDQRYSAHQSVPAGYTSYGLETSVVASAHHQDEEFAPPARVDQKVDYPTAALHIVASYWIGLFGPLVVILVGHKTVFIQFHAWQGLFVTTALWILCLIFVWNWIAFLVLALLSIACFTALTVKALYDFKTSRLFKMPILGDFAQRRAERAAVESRVR